MLARTHGQPASPTILGKEIQVFVERLEGQLNELKVIPVGGKFGGATGNFNAHKVAFPEVDWVSFANSFLKASLDLDRQQTTTQIEHYDQMARLFDCMKRNTRHTHRLQPRCLDLHFNGVFQTKGCSQ